MSTLKICRICLRTEAKGYKFERYQLKYFYEEVTAQKVADNDGLPQWFCYECATILHKFHTFKEKCYIGQKCLKEMQRKGPITYEAIYKLDRATKHLKSTLEKIILNDKVKIFTATDLELETNMKSKLNADLKQEYCIENESIVLNNSYENLNCSDVLAINECAVKTNSNLNEENYEINHENHRSCVNSKISDGINRISDENHKLSSENHRIGQENHRTSDENQKLSSENHISCENHDRACTGDSFHSNKQTSYNDIISDHPTSPISILVQADTVVIPINNKLKKTKTKNVEIGITLSEFGKYLSEENWKKVILTEDEALKEFRNKSEDPKYLDAAFKCTDCFKGFSKKDMLNRHVQSRHSEELGSHECRFCRMRFKWHCLLRKHVQQHYTKYECLLCHIYFNLDSSALLHEEYHSGAARVCAHCGRVFRHVTTYYSHVRTHRSAHVCVRCGASYVSAAGLRQHTTRKHHEDTIFQESASSDEEVGPRELHCARCDVRFHSRRAYTEHLFHSDMHAELLKEDEPDCITPPKKIMGKRLRDKITKELVKRKSDLEISSPMKVKRRKKKVKKWHIKPSTCYQCGEHFSTQAACLKHHLAAHPRTSFHAPSQRHICELCGASLAPGSVALHQNMHTRETVYKCDTCSREFYSKISLQRHARTHTGEKPFGCPLCEKRFTQSNSMKLHYRTFHLKQPYPKRNRKSSKNQSRSTEQDAYAEESDTVTQPEPAAEVPPVPRPAPEVSADTLHVGSVGLGDENIHYLTLS